jgi:uncharacterized protein
VSNLTIYPAEKPRWALVLAHGAGAGQRSVFMLTVARGFAPRHVSTATFDFPYMMARRSAPDRAPVLEQSWREAIVKARETFAALPLFIGGKSMGGRIASQVAAQDAAGLSGLVYLGYPLHPPGKREQRRDAHLPDMHCRMLFVQGTRDAFGTADEIRALLPRLHSATLHAVEGGDHSFKVPGGAAKQAPVLEQIMDAVVEWIAGERR